MSDCPHYGFSDREHCRACLLIDKREVEHKLARVREVAAWAREREQVWHEQDDPVEAAYQATAERLEAILDGQDNA